MGKTVVITGANRGIGLALCEKLSLKYSVHAVCRNASVALRDLPVHIHDGVDVRSADALKALSTRIPPIDILINNAGVLKRDALGSVSVADIKEQFEVNAIGPLLVTYSLLDKMSSGAKVCIVTSRMGSIEDNTSGRMYGYRMSKAAVNMAGKSLSIDLESRGIAVALLHPGYVRTDMTGGNGYIEPEESAQGLVRQIERLNIKNTGSFWHANGNDLPW